MADRKSNILHVLTPAKNVSPFDVNMAYDAGYDAVSAYSHVQLDEVMSLVQDAIFSRGPRGVWHTGIFIGGRDIDLAMDMLAMARKSMVPPFEVSVFADPSGAFTTAAAMMAMVDASLTQQFGSGLSGRKVSVFGATGPVGGCSAVIAACHGADVELVAHSDLSRLENNAKSYNTRYKTSIRFVDGSMPSLKRDILQQTEVALCCATAGVRVLTLEQMAASATLKVVADVNAVPPSGAEGLDVMARGEPVTGTHAIGLGALAIGNVKYKVHQLLFKKMLESQSPAYLDFLSAFDLARKNLT